MSNCYAVQSHSFCCLITEREGTRDFFLFHLCSTVNGNILEYFIFTHPLSQQSLNLTRGPDFESSRNHSPQFSGKTEFDLALFTLILHYLSAAVWCFKTWYHDYFIVRKIIWLGSITVKKLNVLYHSSLAECFESSRPWDISVSKVYVPTWQSCSWRCIGKLPGEDFYQGIWSISLSKWKAGVLSQFTSSHTSV